MHNLTAARCYYNVILVSNELEPRIHALKCINEISNGACQILFLRSALTYLRWPELSRISPSKARVAIELSNWTLCWQRQQRQRTSIVEIANWRGRNCTAGLQVLF